MALRITRNLNPRPADTATRSRPVSGAFEPRLQQRQAFGGSTTGAPTSAHSQALDLLARQRASNLQQLQHELGTPRHSVLSNVPKARHDTVRNSISSIR